MKSNLVYGVSRNSSIGAPPIQWAPAVLPTWVMAECAALSGRKHAVGNKSPRRSVPYSVSREEPSLKPST